LVAVLALPPPPPDEVDSLHPLPLDVWKAALKAAGARSDSDALVDVRRLLRAAKARDRHAPRTLLAAALLSAAKHVRLPTLYGLLDQPRGQDSVLLEKAFRRLAACACKDGLVAVTNVAKFEPAEFRGQALHATVAALGAHGQREGVDLGTATRAASWITTTFGLQPSHWAAAPDTLVPLVERGSVPVWTWMRQECHLPVSVLTANDNHLMACCAAAGNWPLARFLLDWVMSTTLAGSPRQRAY